MNVYLVQLASIVQVLVQQPYLTIKQQHCMTRQMSITSVPRVTIVHREPLHQLNIHVLWVHTILQLVLRIIVSVFLAHPVISAQQLPQPVLMLQLLMDQLEVKNVILVITASWVHILPHQEMVVPFLELFCIQIMVVFVRLDSTVLQAHLRCYHVPQDMNAIQHRCLV